MDRREAHDSGSSDLRAVLEELSARMERVERKLGLEPIQKAVVKGEELEGSKVSREAPEEEVRHRESLEFEVGQNWFAVIGIIALAIGMAFVLSLEFAGWPPFLPSLAGYALCLILFILAELSKQSFNLVSRFVRGAGMLLLFFSTLRFFYFGAEPVLAIDGIGGRSLFVVVLAINLGIGWYRKSPQLFILAYLTGLATVLAVGGSWFALGLLSLMVVLFNLVQVRFGWRALVPILFPLTSVTYLFWAMGNPQLTGAVEVQSGQPFAVFLYIGWIILCAVAVMLRSNREREDSLVQLSGIFLCGIGFAVFFLHSLLGYQESFVLSHLVASVAFLGLAVAWWVREKSAFSTFLYAMTGYAALSFALIKAVPVPEVFVALSLQSLLVIATAIWFRSRFIVLANWLIFLGIIIAYFAVAKGDFGLSIIFGVVALVSARILNWQRDKLELKTNFMRVAYLGITFCVFPYGFYYLLPESYVAVSWVGLSMLYYVLGWLIHNRRYRWMGHMTLLLTVLYVLVIGTGRMETPQRIISFLVVGSILLLISLIFTYMRAKRQKGDQTGGQE